MIVIKLFSLYFRSWTFSRGRKCAIPRSSKHRNSM